MKIVMSEKSNERMPINKLTPGMIFADDKYIGDEGTEYKMVIAVDPRTAKENWVRAINMRNGVICRYEGTQEVTPCRRAVLSTCEAILSDFSAGEICRALTREPDNNNDKFRRVMVSNETYDGKRVAIDIKNGAKLYLDEDTPCESLMNTALYPFGKEGV